MYIGKSSVSDLFVFLADIKQLGENLGLSQLNRELSFIGSFILGYINGLSNMLMRLTIMRKWLSMLLLAHPHYRHIERVL